jgi:hypothetical protein
MKVIRYRASDDIDVQFEDGTIVENKTYNNFKRGKIRNPSSKHPVSDKKGESVRANNGQLMTVINYRNALDIDVQFEDGTIVKHKTYHNFKRGSVDNPSIRKTVIGDTIIASNGQSMTLIGYRNCRDIDVQFEDGTIVEHTKLNCFKKGLIRNPSLSDAQHNEKLGETLKALNGQSMKIIGYNKSDDIDIEFEDGTVVRNRCYNNFRSGEVRNPNFNGVTNEQLGSMSITSKKIVLSRDLILYPCKCKICQSEFVLTPSEILRHHCV